ncbi:hypothetical protein BJ742DRAFT_909438 [Cladochytrium replicatum]|nr:hypothetical protein BJ742DRAFT_909438 [Cladochytrium replicatum]
MAAKGRAGAGVRALSGSPFRSLLAAGPSFPVGSSGNVEVVDYPSHFYDEIKNGILNATRRVILFSLYIGHTEAELVDVIAKSLEQSPSKKIHIVLDGLRGTRGGPKGSSVSILQPLLSRYPSTLQLSLYETLNLRGWKKRLVPPRFNEGFGLMHVKAFVFDDDVVVSGANLNTDYFTNRQDRYVVFRNMRKLGDYYEDLAGTVSKLSSADSADPNGSARRQLMDFGDRWKKATLIDRSSTAHDSARTATVASGDTPTCLVPTLQLGHLDIRDEERALDEVMSVINHTDHRDQSASTSAWRVTLSSPYLNLTPRIIKYIKEGTAEYRIISASPQANGFYGSKGVSGYIPDAYAYLTSKFVRELGSLRREQITLYEYDRTGWTFHAKGLWCEYEGKMRLATIGSSNYGHRSQERDLESQIYLVSEDAAVMDRLQRNVDVIMSDAKEMPAASSIERGKRVPMLLRAAARSISSML